MNRRSFLTTLAATTSTLAVGGTHKLTSTGMSSDALGQVLPKRWLGNTGEAVTMLGIGGYHVGWTSEKDAQEIIEAAMEGGIRFFDNAESYSKGLAEERYGKYLVPKYRDQIYLMTKTQAKDAKTAREHLEGSLRRMKVDQIDLWQIHSLRNPEDVDERLANGVLDVVLKAQEEGKVRHIGFTGHSNPEAQLRMLEQTKGVKFATCQMPVNVMDATYHSFTNQVTPALQKRNMGLLAMKTMADGRFFGMKAMPHRGTVWTSDNPAIPARLSIRDALHYAWALPISVLITGAENASLVREKVDLAKTFTGMSEEQRMDLVARVADLAAEGKTEYYKRPVG